MLRGIEGLAEVLQKKYSTKSRGTVTSAMSPKAMKGAAISPRLNSSVCLVNSYVGLNALELT